MGSRSKKNKKKKWEHLIKSLTGKEDSINRNLKDIDNDNKHKPKGSR